MESSMASLSTDLTALRAESHQELESLERQIGAKTTAEIARIESNAKQEIEAAGKAARLELKRYSAELAVNLAGEKIRTKMTAGAQEMLVRDFVKELDGSAAHAQSN
jgi:F-type H+-transporting ATPase subunit b